MKVRVVPNSKRFSVQERNGLIVVKVRSKAEENKANKELLGQLSKRFKRKVFLLRGARSREKEIAVEGLSDGDAFAFCSNALARG